MSLGAPELATKEYWDQRYLAEDRDGYDWFKTFKELDTFFAKHLAPGHKILILGCGTSSLGRDLYDAGYRHITNVDFSRTAIEAIQALDGDRPGISYHVMDIRKLSFETASFDIVIDKGTMDAILCYQGSPWDPPADVIESCSQEISEASRVLVPSGKFLMISFRPKHFLAPRLRSVSWQDEPSILPFGDFYNTIVAVKKSLQ